MVAFSTPRRACLALAFMAVARAGITVEDPTGHITERHDMGDPSLPPVVLIPGIGGSRLQARIPGQRTDWECLLQQFFQRSWFDLWFDVTEIIPGSVGCFQVRAKPKQARDASGPLHGPDAHCALTPICRLPRRRALCRRPTSSSSGTCGVTST